MGRIRGVLHSRALGLYTVVLAVAGLVTVLVDAKPTEVQRKAPVDEAQPEPVPRVVLVLQPVSDLPAWIPEEGEVVATSESEFLLLLEEHQDKPGFVGTIIITDDPDTTEPWPPTGKGRVHVRFRFRDVDHYNNVWVPDLSGGGWTPGYFLEQQADPAPDPEDALYDVDLRERVDSGTMYMAELRVAKADGAVGVLSSYVLHHQAPPEKLAEWRLICDDAGPWRKYGVCCASQLILCRNFGWLVCAVKPGAACCQGSCFSCFSDCMECVDNPCHSCGPCGLTWLLDPIFHDHED